MLPCKPIDANIVFTTFIRDLQSTVSFRSLLLDMELPMLHRGTNAAYSKRFWLLEGSEGFLRKLINHPDSAVCTFSPGHKVESMRIGILQYGLIRVYMPSPITSMCWPIASQYKRVLNS